MVTALSPLDCRTLKSITASLDLARSIITSPKFVAATTPDHLLALTEAVTTISAQSSAACKLSCSNSRSSVLLRIKADSEALLSVLK